MAVSNAIRVVDVRTAVCQVSETIRIIVRRDSEARRRRRRSQSEVVAEGVDRPLPPDCGWQWQRSTDHTLLTSTDRKAP